MEPSQGREPPANRPDSLTFQQAARFVRLLVPDQQAGRPVDRVLQQMGRPGAEAWLSSAIAAATRLSPEDIQLLRNGKLPLEALVAAKERCKALMAGAADEMDMVAATAGYFTCLAAAAAGHGQMLSSGQHTQGESVFSDLARAAPAPWADLYRAASQPPESGG